MMVAALDTVLLTAGLSAALIGVAFGLRWLARGLGVRIPMRVAAACVVLPLALLLPWLVGDQLLAPTDFLTDGLVPGAETVDDPARYLLFNDAVMQFVPWELELRRLVNEGSLALWSDALEGGSSLWMNPQASVLSPTAWIARAFSIEHFFLVKIALNLLIASLGVATLVRRLGASWASGVLAGVAAALSGAMMPWALFTHTAAVAWVPWTTMALLVVARNPNRQRIAWAAVTVCLLLLAGHPEVAFAGGCLGVLVAGSVRTRRVGWSRVGGSLVLVAGLGFLLAAPAVLPFLGAVSQSQRIAELEMVSAPSLSTMALDPRTWFKEGSRRVLKSVFHPNAAGRPFLDEFSGSLNWLETSSVYPGLWALAGSALALGLWLRRSLAFVGFAAITGLLAAGFIPALWIARSLPLISEMAYPRAALVGSLALCVAGGLGFDAIRSRMPSALAWLAVIALGLASVGVGGRSNLAFSIVAWGLIAGLLALAGRTSAERSRWCLFALMVIVVGQLPWSWRLLPSADPRGFYPPSDTFLKLAATTDSTPEALPKRVLGTEHLGYPSLLSVYGFHQTRSHNPMAPEGWLRVNRAAFGFAPDADNYFAPVTTVSKQWLDALGIGGILFSTHGNVPVIDAVDLEEPPTASDPMHAGLELVSDDGAHQVYRNADALEPWFVASTWEVVEEPDLSQRLTRLPTARHAFVSRPIGAEAFAQASRELALHRQPRERTGPVLTTNLARPGSVSITVDWEATENAASRERPGFLLATSLAGPEGWTVVAHDVDGERLDVEITQVHGAFLAAWVPSGAADLRLRFVPPYLRGSLLSALLGVVLFGWLVKRRT